MTTTGNERYWGIVAPVMPAGMIAEAAKQQEDMGLLGTFAAQVYRPPWTALAAATTTTRVQLASGIAQAFVRSPFETAMAAMDLDRISGGRFILGLGPTVRSWSEGAYGVPGYGRPLAHLREAVQVIRLVIAKSHTGELKHFKGSYYELDWSEFQGAPPPLRTSFRSGWRRSVGRWWSLQPRSLTASLAIRSGRSSGRPPPSQSTSRPDLHVPASSSRTCTSAPGSG